MKIFSPNIKGTLTLAPDAVSVLSGSFTGSFSGTATTASYVSVTNVDGFTAYSSSVESRVSTNEADISSLQTDSGSFSTRVTNNESNISSLTSQTSSYLQNTTDTLTGDLTVTGKITAQEFHTEFVSASIIYQSGSVKLGDSVDDRISVTGSIFITRGAIMNPATLEESITIPSNYNGLLIGPLTNPETITVESNANLVII